MTTILTVILNVQGKVFSRILFFEFFKTRKTERCMVIAIDEEKRIRNFTIVTDSKSVNSDGVSISSSLCIFVVRGS